MPFSWFDGVVIVLLGVGVFKGKKHGMSEELFPLMAWLAVAVGAGMLYQPVGNFLAEHVRIPRYWIMVLTYIFIAFMLHTIFTVIRKKAKDQVQKIDIFGKMEYFLGMIAGALKVACMIVVGVSLFCSKIVTEEEVKRDRAKQENDLGTTFFPTRKTAHYDIVYGSFTGDFLRNKVPNLVMQPVTGGPGKK